MNFSLREHALSDTLITAHRGITCANIPGNTLDAFDCALVQGADMIELDVTNSQDGELFIFHPGMEWAFLGSEQRICNMPASEVHKLRFLNFDRVPTAQPVFTLDQALEHLKGRCYINIDKFWDNPKLICDALHRHNMLDQIVVKSGFSENVVQVLEELAPDINFMLIVKDKDDYSHWLKDTKIRYVGAEVLFDQENAPVASDAYIQQMHKDQLIVWVNAIVYNYKTVLAAGHNDDISAIGRMDEGWGWLLNKGFNIIQTDFPLMLRQYMDAWKMKK